jgi:hypothetical protein
MNYNHGPSMSNPQLGQVNAQQAHQSLRGAHSRSNS